MHRGNSDLSQRLIKQKVSIRHSLDTSFQPMDSSLSVSAAAENDCNLYTRTIYNSKRSANSESNIGSITLATATGSTPAIKLEVCSLFHQANFLTLLNRPISTPSLKTHTNGNATFLANRTLDNATICHITVILVEVFQASRLILTKAMKAVIWTIQSMPTK